MHAKALILFAVLWQAAPAEARDLVEIVHTVKPAEMVAGMARNFYESARYQALILKHHCLRRLQDEGHRAFAQASANKLVWHCNANGDD